MAMTNKEFYTKHLSDLNERKEKLNASIIECESKEERASIGETLKTLATEISECEEMLAQIDEPAENKEPAPAETEGERKMDIVATVRNENGENKEKRTVNKIDTEEYRNAFMNYVCRGVKIPAELRADAITASSDASAVIPTTILNEMVVQLKTYGNIYSRVRKLNIQGGVNIPILSLKPTATWISADTGTSQSDKQKIQANTSVSFSYYGLECKIAQSLLVNVTTLEMFQNMFSKLAVEAIAKALDIAIIKGDGSGEPQGISTDSRVPATQIITIPAAEVGSWTKWKKNVFAKIPSAYRNGSFIMAQATFDGYIDGMVDSNGQPIGRVNYGIDNGESYRFGGKEVLIVEPDVIKDWDGATGNATTGDVVALFVNLNDYAFNSNLEMKVVKWEDNDTNEIKNKVILVGDGKLVDANGVLVIKKGV